MVEHERPNTPVVLMSVVLGLGAVLLIGGGVLAWVLVKGTVTESVPAVRATETASATPQGPSVAVWRAQPAAGDKDLLGAWGHATLAFAVGKAGTIVKLAESGAKWEVDPSGTTNDLSAIAGDADALFVVGAKGTILTRKSDAPAWKPMTSGTTTDLASVLARESEAWAVGHAGAIVHLDASHAWQPEKSGAFQNLRSVAAEDALVIAVGAAGTIVERKDDAKPVWKAAKSGTFQDLYAVAASRTDAWAVGKAGTVLHRAAETGAWETEKAVTKKDLHGISVEPGEGGAAPVVWVVGQGGTILRSGEPGKWTVEDSHATADLDAVIGLGGGIAYAFGANGTVLRRGL